MRLVMFRLCSGKSYMSSLALAAILVGVSACGRSPETTRDLAHTALDQSRANADAIDALTARADKAEARNRELEQSLIVQQGNLERLYEDHNDLAKKHNLVNDRLSAVEQRLIQ